MTGPAAEVRRQVELLTGRELLGDGTMRLLEPAQWQERRSQQPTRN